MIALQEYLHITPLTWLLMALFCGGCAYYAVGKGGYTALLSAITLMIVAGHLTNPMMDSLWRAINVLNGIVVALVLSFALPLYATWSWRYKLADALRRCRAVYSKMAGGGTALVDEQSHAMSVISSVLPELRSLMPSVCKETGVPMQQLEGIQRSVRIIVSTLELLAITPPVTDDKDDRSQETYELAQHSARISSTLVELAGLLGGPDDQLATQAPDGQEPAIHDTRPSDEYASLTRHLDAELDPLAESAGLARQALQFLWDRPLFRPGPSPPVPVREISLAAREGRDA